MRATHTQPDLQLVHLLGWRHVGFVVVDAGYMDVCVIHLMMQKAHGPLHLVARAYGVHELTVEGVHVRV